MEEIPQVRQIPGEGRCRGFSGNYHNVLTG